MRIMFLSCLRLLFLLFFFSFNVCATEGDPGWRWRDSVDFEYTTNGTVYSTVGDTNKIQIIFEGEGIDSLERVHQTLCTEVLMLRDTNAFKAAAGKKDTNIALGVVGTLVQKDDGALTLVLERLNADDGTNYYFPSGRIMNELTPNGITYRSGAYNLREKDDRDALFNFLGLNPEARLLVTAISEKETEFLSFKDSLAPPQPELPDPFDDFDAKRWDEITKTISDVLKKERAKQGANYNRTNVGRLISNMHVIELLREIHLELNERLAQLVSERWVDSEKYLLARVAAILPPNSADGAEILARTLHIHTHLDMCAHCAEFVSSCYRSAEMPFPMIPFVSSYYPYEDRRLHGHDGNYHQRINFHEFWRVRVYPSWPIPLPTAPLKLEHLPDFVPVEG